MRNQDANRPQRIKIIIITIIAAIIIFIFGAWLITSAIKSVEKKQQANSEQNTTAQMRRIPQIIKLLTIKLRNSLAQTMVRLLVIRQILLIPVPPQISQVQVLLPLLHNIL